MRSLSLEDVSAAVVGDEHHKGDGRGARHEVEPRVQLQVLEEAREGRAERVLWDPQQQQAVCTPICRL